MANYTFDQAEGLRRLLGSMAGMGSDPAQGAEPGTPGSATPPVIQVGTTPDSIKSAYALIKRLAQQEGWRHFSVQVTGAVSQSEAKLVYDNMAAAATKYLSVQLYAVARAQHPLTRSGRAGGSAHFGT